MAEYRWSEPAAIQTALTTELDSLATDANAVMSAGIDNATARKTFVTLELYLASVDLSAQTNPALYVWFLTQIDGTNYEDGGSSIDPARQPDVIIPLNAVSGEQRSVIRNVIFPPYSVELLLGNRAGAALAASGNTLKYRLHSMEDN